jgi:DNA-binding NtrC family response regulator
VFDVPPVGVVIGADAACDVVLADRAVSSRHCSVRPSAHGFEVADLGSRNGTFLDGAQLTRATVPLGAALRVGGSLLQLVPACEPVEIPPSEAQRFGQMVGESLAMRRIFALLERASTADASILLGGESGTGKEIAARAIHDASPRKDGPFVVFDCGAASETLIESDLFGHLRGAFTGAQTDRVGAFAAADRGTLFLDEIGDLPIRLQPKLLRLLESGEVTPLGGRKSVRADVRVVAATHHDLWRDVGKGTFRGDLYYRLAVVEVELPALRRRLDDVPALVRLFLKRAGATDLAVRGPNLDRLLGYGWPGNVRELRNVIDRAVALAPPGAGFAELPILLRQAEMPPDPPVASGGGGSGGPSVRANRPWAEVKAQAIARLERDYLTDLLSVSRGNLSQAARTSGLERKYLYRMLDKAGLSPPRAQGPGKGAAEKDAGEAADAGRGADSEDPADADVGGGDPGTASDPPDSTASDDADGGTSHENDDGNDDDRNR